jgi:hypothetical protein
LKTTTETHRKSSFRGQIVLECWLLLIVLLAGWAAGASQVSLRDGDIIFQTSKSSQSLAIQRATHSLYSHMGMVVFRNGKPFVFEASGPVRDTPLDAWIQHGVDGHYVVKRVREASRHFTPEDMARAHALMAKFQGRPYDTTFGWSDDRFYCSELVWKIYDRAFRLQVGELQRLGDFDLTDPAVQTELRKKYGNHVPLDMRVISPASMFNSPLLETVEHR